MALADHLAAGFCKVLNAPGRLHRNPVALQKHQRLIFVGIPARERIIVVDIVEPIVRLVDAVH